MTWVPFRIDDHLAVTRGWPLVAEAVYFRLVCFLWIDGSLPADERELQAIVGAKPAEWRRAWPYVQSYIPVGDDGRRRNPDIAAQREEALARYERRSASARHAAEARWAKP